MLLWGLHIHLLTLFPFACLRAGVFHSFYLLASEGDLPILHWTHLLFRVGVHVVHCAKTLGPKGWVGLRYSSCSTVRLCTLIQGRSSLGSCFLKNSLKDAVCASVGWPSSPELSCPLPYLCPWWQQACDDFCAFHPLSHRAPSLSTFF
jgi:hypothetical protein